MSPVLIISNRCGSTILSNPTILCDRRFTKFDKLKNIFNGLYVQKFLYLYHIFRFWECGGLVVESLPPEREVGVQNLPPSCCVLEQYTFTPRKILVIPKKR